MRLDQYLVEKGFFQSRNKASTAIKESAVLVDGKIITKANYDITGENVEIIKDVHPYVSRGGLKLEAAIKTFQLDFKDKVVLDIGASTGGFTDCALQFGASYVYSVDVGTNQLDFSLLIRDDICVMEQTNILDVEGFPKPLDFIVMDVSFVSIEKILPAIDRFLTDKNALVCLIKPQYELGNQYFKNGIVKDRHQHLKVLEKISACFALYNMGIVSLIASPILGGSGNKEYLAFVKRNRKTNLNFLKLV